MYEYMKYFNGTGIFTFPVPATLVLFDTFNSKLSGLDSVTADLFNDGSALLNGINFLFLNNFRYILLNYKPALQHQGLSHYLLVRYLFCLCSR